jgi:hypothetical protein
MKQRAACVRGLPKLPSNSVTRSVCGQLRQTRITPLASFVILYITPSIPAAFSARCDRNHFPVTLVRGVTAFRDGPPKTDEAARFPSLTEALLVSVAILALLAALVGGSRGSLVAPHADARFDISLVVPAQERFLVLRVRSVAFPAACRAALRPASEATDADAVLLAKRSHHTIRNLASPAHRSARAHHSAFPT